jgi:hypothetical protein
MLVLGACSDDDDPTTTEQPGDRSTAAAAESAPTSAGPAAASGLSVDGPLRTGDVFQVSFAGELRDLRGGYMWVRTLDGSGVALLRSDGNPEIEMSSTMDLAEYEMLDDGLTGETSNFVLPTALPPGQYTFCTANSRPEACTDIEVLAD